eukprot:3760264-Karenia_brevis.AAC.1
MVENGQTTDELVVWDWCWQAGQLASGFAKLASWKLVSGGELAQTQTDHQAEVSKTQSHVDQSPSQHQRGTAISSQGPQ